MANIQGANTAYSYPSFVFCSSSAMFRVNEREVKV